MRMLMSISGHSSELRMANHSSRSTVLQLKCVSDTISSWFENHQPHKTKTSSVIYAPFIQNSNQMASRLTVTIFSTPVIFKATSKLFGSQGCSDGKNWLDFSGIFFKTCRFRSSILLSLQVFIQRGATLESGLTVARFLSTNHNSLLHIATNEIALFCLDHRSHRMAWRGKGGAKGQILRYVEIFWNKKRFSLLYKTTHFDVICDLLLNRRTATWNLFVKHTNYN